MVHGGLRGAILGKYMSVKATGVVEWTQAVAVREHGDLEIDALTRSIDNCAKSVTSQEECLDHFIARVVRMLQLLC